MTEGGGEDGRDACGEGGGETGTHVRDERCVGVMGGGESCMGSGGEGGRGMNCGFLALSKLWLRVDLEQRGKKSKS